MDLTEVSLEDLKKEAIKRGYYLAKKQPRIILKKCSCGCRRRKTEHNVGPIRYTLICCRCGKRANGYTLNAARENWNLVADI